MIVFKLLLVLMPFLQPDNNVRCVSSQEMNLYNQINDYREQQKLSPIPFSAKLTEVAQAHVKDLSENYEFSKTNRCNPHSWSDNGAWTPCCYTADHKKASCMWDKPKEIAGYQSAGYEIAFYASAGAQATSALNGWISSSSHHPLLINSGQWQQVTWQAIGVGIYKNYAVVWFGAEPDESLPQTCN